MSDGIKRSFNLSADTHARLVRVADKENRSVNAQVVRWIEQKLREYEQREKTERADGE